VPLGVPNVTDADGPSSVVSSVGSLLAALLVAVVSVDVEAVVWPEVGAELEGVSELDTVVLGLALVPGCVDGKLDCT
jgi:hypothetical protein